MYRRRTIVLLFGPAIHAVSGVSTHLNQLLESRLSSDYDLMHYQVGREGRNENAVSTLFRLLWSPIGLAVCIVTKRPHIIHINTSMSPKAFWRDTVYLFIAKMFGCKVVCQIHGGSFRNFLRKHQAIRNIVTWILTIPDVVLVLTSDELEIYSHYLPGADVRIVPNAIDLEPYLDHCQKVESEGYSNLVYIGRLAKNKGIDEAIDALRILAKEPIYRKVRLLIAGTGTEERRLKEYVRQQLMEERVFFLGPIHGEEKIRFWCEAAIFLFPTSLNEGLPYTVIESLASGTPLVATKVGGIKDAVREGVEGVFVEPQDPAMLAAKVRDILENPERLREMSDACVRRAKECYGVDRLERQIKEVYGQLCSLSLIHI